MRTYNLHQSEFKNRIMLKNNNLNIENNSRMAENFLNMPSESVKTFQTKRIVQLKFFETF